MVSDGISGGFTEWRGGKCPVPSETELDVILRDGYSGSCNAEDLYWTHTGNGRDIVAYRVIQEAKQQPTKPQLPTATTLLNAAAGHMRDRAATYDQPDGERSMAKTVIAFNTITNHDITESEGWLLLQLLKDVRQWQRPDYHADSAEDCIAYAALKAEALAKEGSL